MASSSQSQRKPGRAVGVRIPSKNSCPIGVSPFSKYDVHLVNGLTRAFRISIMKHILHTLITLLLLHPSVFAQDARSTYGGDVYWNATPNDVNNMLKNLKDFADINYNMDIKFLGQISPDPEQNPVLFRSGHYNFSYSPEERKKLREFMLGGGMVIYNTGLGSQPFYRSVIREMKEIFPEQPVQRLTSDHPIFHSFYDIDRVKYAPGVAAGGYKGNEPWFDAVEINCRVVALISRFGMAVGWQDSVQDNYQAYHPESAFKLGINIFSYASAMRAWAKNAAQAMKYIDKPVPSTDKVSIVQVAYDGVWKTRHVGMSVLLHTFNQQTDVPVKFNIKDLKLNDPNIFNAPLLYLTGHEHFNLSDKEIRQLRQYLENGGFLFAEACCGRKGFDLAFRQLMPKVLPTSRLKRLDPSNDIFSYPHQLSAVGVTPTLQQEFGKAAMPPYLEGIELEGNMVVLYSRFGLSGGWEMSQSPYARGYNEIGSLKLGQAILMHAVTQ